MLIPVQISFDYEGTASRECNEDGTWAETDVTGCQSRQFMELTSSVSMLKLHNALVISREPGRHCEIVYKCRL